MKACFISMHIPKEVQTEPWGLTGEWCWKKAFDADILNPRQVAKQWTILDKYDLIFVPGYINTLQWLRELYDGHKPRGQVIAWIDYASEMIWRLPAVQQDPMLPAEVRKADVIISADPGLEPYYIGTEAKVLRMVHPVDGKVLQERIKPDKIPGAPACLWVYHFNTVRWGLDFWPRTIPTVKAHPEYSHIAVGLGPEAKELAVMYYDAAFMQLTHKDFLKLLAGSALCVDMHPYRSMGRVVLEAASLGTPVFVNREATNNVPVDFWYNGLETSHKKEQSEVVKQHWLKQAKADLEEVLGG